MPSTIQNTATATFNSLEDVVRNAVAFRDYCLNQNEIHYQELQECRRDWQEFYREYNERKNQTRMMQQQQQATRNYGTVGMRPGTATTQEHRHHHTELDDSSSGRTGYYSPPPIIRADGRGCNIHITLPHVPSVLSPPKYTSTPNPAIGSGAPPRHQRNINENATNLCTPSPRPNTVPRPPAPTSGTGSTSLPDHSSQGTQGFQEAKCPRCGARLGIIFEIYHLNNNC